MENLIKKNLLKRILYKVNCIIMCESMGTTLKKKKDKQKTQHFIYTRTLGVRVPTVNMWICISLLVIVRYISHKS